VGVRVGVAYSRNKLALRTRLRNPNLKSKCYVFYRFRDIRVHMDEFMKFVGGLWAWQTFLVQSIGIDENNTFQLKFLF